MDRLTSSCRFPPLLQLPTAAQLSYSHQMIVIITKLVAVMMIINHWAHLVSKAYSKDWFRIRRSQKLFHLGHRRGTSLLINVNVKRWCTKRSKTKMSKIIDKKISSGRLIFNLDIFGQAGKEAPEGRLAHCWGKRRHAPQAWAGYSTEPPVEDGEAYIAHYSALPVEEEV